jgi:hypothetical protein
MNMNARKYQKVITLLKVIQFAEKFPDEIKDKNQLQRFLGSLNYVSEYYQDLRKICRPLFQRLQNNPPPWTDTHSQIVRQIKRHVKTLPCLGLPSPVSFKIVETDASELGYGGILYHHFLAIFLLPLNYWEYELVYYFLILKLIILA